ncbi:NAD-dependent succinate-semialdehyde dehydrogenase [Corynebacterium sp. TAE3-ERU12]|uniref:NAD-dependent succinate-semialdehyde dehydrogenase n=1 Tax=Corynebacterium sp. TAE3-ERU12 TaxID=2849491 RepID=UPI001C454A5E|nr:NAD-dependent succinate-semialdehyde dehydrogenase [Corynebacterium sp. TAE3-ERU12]MBV7294775.1 NAD-dependent succinate-semialdehyde dehydrogenase [Corynebacterium sp. TAE3-ERU12]
MSTKEFVQKTHDEILSGVPTELYINGEFRAAENNATFELRNPATNAVLTDVAAASAGDAKAALDAAAAAGPEWAATPPRKRGEILYRAYELITENAEQLTYLQSLEMGRALPDSAGEVVYGGEFFRWFAEEAVRITGDFRRAPAGNARIAVVRQPVGPVLAITPWNFPLAMGARKIAPALAAGCPVVLKPAAKTPLTMLFLAKMLHEAGVPAGVVNIVPTDSASHVSELMGDTRLRKFTFTGSTEIGQMLGAKAAETSMKVSLELGGNAPFVVFEDADIDKAVAAIPGAKLRNGGQVCIAPNRFLVHESLADEFAERVAQTFRSLKIGPGTDPDTQLGPLALRDQQETVQRLVKDAIDKGATVVCGGAERPEGVDENGYYVQPTVLTDVPAEADLIKEEIFGPVVAVTTFSDRDEAIARANDTIFGLAAYLFSENLGNALDAAERIESGMVAVNKGSLSDPSAPFGGVKQSGVGREGGFVGIDEFLETKFISLEG